LDRNKGWVKLHRKILDTGLTSSQFKFFVGAIILAKSPNSKECGLVNRSLRERAKKLNMSHVEVWHKEQELADKGMVTLLSKGFTINNYNLYQTGKSVSHSEQQVLAPVNKSVSHSEQSVSYSEHFVSPSEQQVLSRVNNTGVNNEVARRVATKKYKNIKKKKKKETFTEYCEHLRKEFTDINFDLELRKFNLYWSDGNRKLKNPKLALFNWMTKCREFAKSKKVGADGWPT